MRSSKSPVLIALLALAGLVLALVPAGAASAAGAEQRSAAVESQRGRANFGSLAYAVDGAWGVAYDYGTKRGAKKAALRRCRNHSEYPGSCRAGWVRNGCAALAVRSRDGFVRKIGYGVAFTARAAKREAKRKLRGPDRILTWVCTTRYR